MSPEQLKQAARWHAWLGDVPDGGSREAAQAGFAAWRQTSDEHRRAFAAVAAVDGIARALRHEPALQALGDAALARAAAGPRRHRHWGMIALVGTVIVAPVAALTIHRLSAPPSATSAPVPSQVIVTGPGERRIVDLGNAARVTLDTSSRLVVSGSTLGIRGQAYVSAGQAPVRIQLRGSSILVQSGGVNVRTTATGATILAEGKTATVRRDEDAAGGTMLKPGYVLTLGPDRPNATAAIDPAAITSWRRGWLLFDDVPLAQAAAEINRYRTVPIRLAAGTGGMRISGSFRTDGATDFLAAVAATLPATVTHSPSGQTIIVPTEERTKN